jgi:hypothetical protein
MISWLKHLLRNYSRPFLRSINVVSEELQKVETIFYFGGNSGIIIPLCVSLKYVCNFTNSL